MAQIIEQIETLRTRLRSIRSSMGVPCPSRVTTKKMWRISARKSVSTSMTAKEIAGGKSTYQIAQQPVYPAKNKMLNSRRGDLVLLINGMPLIPYRA